MINKERILQILRAPIVSEKASTLLEKNNTIVIEVEKKSTKYEIKCAIQYLFNIKVNNVQTLIVHGKNKNYKNRVGRRNDWKKAYITLKEGQHLPIIDNVD